MRVSGGWSLALFSTRALGFAAQASLEVVQFNGSAWLVWKVVGHKTGEYAAHKKVQRAPRGN
jgi:hypothetical protein